MSNATRHALMSLVSDDTLEALDEIANMLSEDALDSDTVSVDFDSLDSTDIDAAFYIDTAACESLDTEITSQFRY